MREGERERGKCLFELIRHFYGSFSSDCAASVVVKGLNALRSFEARRSYTSITVIGRVALAAVHTWARRSNAGSGEWPGSDPWRWRPRTGQTLH